MLDRFVYSKSAVGRIGGGGSGVGGSSGVLG